MNFSWKWPPFNRISKTKPGILILSLGLATGFACGQVIHSKAESNQAIKNNQTSEDKNIPVKIQSSNTAVNTKQSELEALNRWRAAVESLSFSKALLDPWWSYRLHKSDWPFRDLEPDCLDSITGWSRPRGLADFVPRVESKESLNEITISAEVPGVEYNNLDVTVNDDSITIKGEKKAENTQEDTSKKFQCVERAYGSFARTISLPCKIETDKAQATLRNGILTITAPKSQLAQNEGKKLTIKNENGLL